eukprot:TRINITY_DN9070_c0_g1_i1.p1 TRINITY_DN9070_c0_g1~~TRINITY_DN9070_c0_g1_i1.p1  ORF type:complete len:513 (+),score=105.82 TRINITY_DN9070_c0_g1_i1:62-1600(+)
MNSLSALRGKVSAGMTSDATTTAMNKATNTKAAAPKEKHVQRLISIAANCSSDLSAVDVINALKKRIASQREWIVCLKSMIVIHRLINAGSRDFLDEMTKASHLLNFHQFMDGKTSEGLNVSLYMRAYSEFLTERLYFARDAGWDQSLACYSKENLSLSEEVMISRLEALEKIFAIIFSIEIPRHGIENEAIKSASILIVQDSLAAFTSYSRLLIVVLDLFFKLDRALAQRALKCYKAYVENTKTLRALIDYSAILSPSFTRVPILSDVPTNLLAACEAHVKELESSRSRTSSMSSISKLSELPPESKQAGVGSIRPTQFHPSLAPSTTPTSNSFLADEFSSMSGTPSSVSSKGMTSSFKDSFFDPFTEPPQQQTRQAPQQSTQNQHQAAPALPKLAPPPSTPRGSISGPSRSNSVSQPPAKMAFPETSQTALSDPFANMQSAAQSSTHAPFPMTNQPHTYQPHQQGGYDEKAQQIRALTSAFVPSSQPQQGPVRPAVDFDSLLAEMKSSNL